MSFASPLVHEPFDKNKRKKNVRRQNYHVGREPQRSHGVDKEKNGNCMDGDENCKRCPKSRPFVELPILCNRSRKKGRGAKCQLHPPLIPRVPNPRSPSERSEQSQKEAERDNDSNQVRIRPNSRKHAHSPSVKRSECHLGCPSSWLRRRNSSRSCEGCVPHLSFASFASSASLFHFACFSKHPAARHDSSRYPISCRLSAFRTRACNCKQDAPHPLFAPVLCYQLR